jgi:hypothetical protein
MVRKVLASALLVAVGAAAASVMMSPKAETDAAARPDRPPQAGSAPAREPVAFGERPAADRPQSDVARRVELLSARVAEEAAERQRLEARIDTLTAQLAALGGDARDAAPAGAAALSGPGDNAAASDSNAVPLDFTVSAMERALEAAGIDAGTASDIKRRRDELTMKGMYLRDEATREQWLDSPRFAQEMAAIDAQRTSVRDEIGDAAYDQYLFALGHPNRVRVDEVLSESPAAQAGLQPGDMILRYGETRIFAPDELVAQTRGGTMGDTVRLEIIRNGERLQVEVPRGPLGLQIAATQDQPQSS